MDDLEKRFRELWAQRSKRPRIVLALVVAALTLAGIVHHVVGH